MPLTAKTTIAEHPRRPRKAGKEVLQPPATMSERIYEAEETRREKRGGRWAKEERKETFGWLAF